VDKSPMFRVPGASVAAKAYASAATGAGAVNAGTGARGGQAAVATSSGSGGARPAATAAASNATDTDMDDGFQQVRGRGSRRNGAAAPGADATEEVGPCGERDAQPNNHVEEDCDDAEEEPTPSQLQQAWREEMALVKRLRQQGLPAEHLAMQAACQARDEAERSWRNAKDPTPASVRLNRAQSKLESDFAASRRSAGDHGLRAAARGAHGGPATEDGRVR
jgi:hypothetical protein